MLPWYKLKLPAPCPPAGLRLEVGFAALAYGKGHAAQGWGKKRGYRGVHACASNSLTLDSAGWLSFLPQAPSANYMGLIRIVGLTWWLSGEEFTWEWRKHGLYPWVGNIPWRRKWQPTPVFLPGKSHRQRSLLGYSPWGRKRDGHNLATKQQQIMFPRKNTKKTKQK